MKGRWGGPRMGSGRKHTVEGAPRRNRVVVLLTDDEHAKLGKLAARDAAPVGTKAWELLSRALRRVR
jgi:hypothetical protein